MRKSIYSILAFVMLTSFIAKAQQSTVFITGIQVTAFNITPEAMLSASIMNNGDPVSVETVTKLYNSDNQLLLTVISAPFSLSKGFNGSFSGNRKAAVIEYAANPQANYLKTTRNMPSGNFEVHVELKTPIASEISDKFIYEIESDHNQYLYLVSPADKDSMEIKNPMLVWAHSEPFNILSKGESFMMILTEMKTNQSPEEAIVMNTPIMTKQNLTTHNLQYPYEARGLEEGKHYAWMVQKMSNGVVVAKTEVWEFSIIKKRPIIANYASLTTKLDAGYYTAKNDKVYFKLDEEYMDGKLNIKIFDSNRNVIEPKAKNETLKNKNEYNVKKAGYNQYEIDLEQLNVSSGFYTLEVLGAKGELYMLNFYVEK